jgi:hypothetical protein
MHDTKTLAGHFEAALDPEQLKDGSSGALAEALSEVPPDPRIDLRSLTICQYCRSKGFVLVVSPPVCFSYKCPRCGGRGVV